MNIIKNLFRIFLSFNYFQNKSWGKYLYYWQVYAVRKSEQISHFLYNNMIYYHGKNICRKKIKICFHFVDNDIIYQCGKVSICRKRNQKIISLSNAILIKF